MPPVNTESPTAVIRATEMAGTSSGRSLVARSRTTNIAAAPITSNDHVEKPSVAGRITMITPAKPTTTVRYCAPLTRSFSASAATKVTAKGTICRIAWALANSMRTIAPKNSAAPATSAATRATSGRRRWLRVVVSPRAAAMAKRTTTMTAVRTKRAW